VGVGGFELRQLEKHSVGDARPQAGAIADCQRSGEGNARGPLTYVVGTEARELTSQQVGQAARSAGKKLHLRAGRSAGADDLAPLASDIAKTMRKLPGEVVGLSRAEDPRRTAHCDLDLAANHHAALLATRRAVVVCG